MNSDGRNLKNYFESVTDNEFSIILNTFIDKDIIDKKLVTRIYEDAIKIFKTIVLNIDAIIQRIDKYSFIIMIDDILPYLLYYIYDDIKSGEILSDAILLLFTAMNQNHPERLYGKNEIIRLILRRFIKTLIYTTNNFSAVIKYELWDRTVWKITLGISNKINIDDCINSILTANEDDIKMIFNNIQCHTCEIYDRLYCIKYMETGSNYMS